LRVELFPTVVRVTEQLSRLAEIIGAGRVAQMDGPSRDLQKRVGVALLDVDRCLVGDTVVLGSRCAAASGLGSLN
jgi:hypothetical protein